MKIFHMMRENTHHLWSVCEHQRAAFVSGSFFLQSCGFWELNSGLRAPQQAPLPSEPSHEEINYHCVYVFISSFLFLSAIYFVPSSFLSIPLPIFHVCVASPSRNTLSVYRMLGFLIFLDTVGTVHTGSTHFEDFGALYSNCVISLWSKESGLEINLAHYSFSKMLFS